jgi:DNA modification methylase
MTVKKMKPIDSLKFDPSNSRKHDERNIKAIMDSLERHGQRKPIVCYSDMVVAGNGTLQAAKRLGWTEIWVNDDSFASIEDAKAYAIQDNRSAELATWDDVQLGDTLQELKDAGWDLEQIGFNDADLKDLIDKPQGTDGLTDPDEVPEVAQNEFGVKRGDIWQLGNHRLMCGDSTLKDDVDNLMNGNYANIMITDPPYGVKLDQSWRDKALGNKALGKGNKKTIANDDKADWLETYKLFSGNIAYVWHASKYPDIVMNNLREAGFDICQQIIWNKSVMIMGGCDYHYKHEPCWYAVRKNKNHDWIGDRKQTSVIDDAPPNHIMGGSKEEKTEHPSQKPLSCMLLLKNHSGNVYDPFLGSGTTLIACEKTGRKCYGMELDEHYCSVIIKRWQDFTGKKAERIVEGA